MRGCLPCLRYEGRCMIRIMSLGSSLEPLREWFNDKSAFVRVLAIQSPT
jgi:hypothetical protein